MPSCLHAITLKAFPLLLCKDNYKKPVSFYKKAIFHSIAKTFVAASLFSITCMISGSGRLRHARLRPGVSADDFQPGAGDGGAGEEGVEEGDDDVVAALCFEDVAFDALEGAFGDADAVALFERAVHEAACVG